MSDGRNRMRAAARTVRVGADVDMLPSITRALAHAEVTEIVVEPGVYVEHVTVAPRGLPLTIRSATGRASDVTLTFGLSQGDRAPGGLAIGQDCATLTIDADDVTLEGITVENSFDRDRHPGARDTQAIALRTRGDRFVASGCRFVGRQDTVLLDAPSSAAVRRAHLRNCEIEGDVDIVYGRATALIEGGRIRSTGPGYVAAPSTARENPRGFLFWQVDLTGDLDAGSVKLARPWHPGADPDAVGQAVFAGCRLGAHVSSDPWTDMGGFSWRDARFGAHGNVGPGAVRDVADGGPEDRPDPLTWLGDGAPASVVTAPRIVIASDSTASAYPPDRAPRTGWGECLSARTGGDVRNLAISGASSRSFIELGALDRALDLLRPGDLLLVAFGHNDAKNDRRFSDVFTQYEANLRRYLVGARARGATPVLLTPVERRFFVGGRAHSTHAGYPERVRALADAEGVPLIDLTTRSRALWQQLGEEPSKSAFLWLDGGEWDGYPDGVEDDTHFSVRGAELVADLVATGLREAGLLQPDPADAAA